MRKNGILNGIKLDTKLKSTISKPTRLSNRIKRNYKILFLNMLFFSTITILGTVKYCKYKQIVEFNNYIKDNSIVSTNNILMLQGTVIALNTLEDIVSVLDVDGHIYEFYGAENWLVNDNCTMLINNNGTVSRKDDVILDVLYNMN